MEKIRIHSREQQTTEEKIFKSPQISCGTFFHGLEGRRSLIIKGHSEGKTLF